MIQFKNSNMSRWVIISLLFFIMLHGSIGRSEESERLTVTSDAVAVSVAAPLSSEDANELRQTADNSVPIANQGMRGYIDPKTGRLGAPPPGIQPPGLSIAEQKMLNRSDVGLQTRTLPNGTVVVDHQGRFMSMAVGTINPQGKTVVNCTHTLQDTEAALQ